ncbi:RadC family protein [Desulfovibrio oxyclinae]|jgi:DNA repair protein RadC|uniref:RadC family protein n=1 Tax=Desulfovibrio oxyclinae TaxID=63560 RepID=UPI0003757750|nr:DNA repair protein RadC [Desulfovibrio oxyclinae]
MSKDKPHYHGHRQRLKERLTRDPRALADYEILELLLASVLPRRDTKPLAKTLMEAYGSLGAVMQAQPEDLKRFEGAGPAVTAQWHLMRELLARVAEDGMRSREVLGDPDAVARAAMARLGGCRTEEFWVALLDTRNRVIAWERVGAGTVDRVEAYPREVMALALRHKARSVILVHNHPGGDPTPSDDDQLLTLGMIRAASALDVLVADHVIVSETDFFSFSDKGMI